MTLIHELGHHLWPHHMDQDRARLSEGVANGLVYQLSDYRDRKYLFYKTRLLQSPEYGSYVGLVHHDLWWRVADSRASSWPAVKGLLDRSDLLHRPGGFWHGSPCDVFQRPRADREWALRAAAVEPCLTSYLMHGRSWPDRHDYDGDDGLRDIEVIHALYEAILGHGNNHAEIRGTLHGAAAAGPVTHPSAAPAEVIVAGRALAFEFPDTPEGRDIIRRSLEREAGDCYSWVRWDVHAGLDRLAAQATPIARDLLRNRDPGAAARAKSVLGRFAIDRLYPGDPDGVAPYADRCADLLMSDSALDRGAGVCKLKRLAERHWGQTYRAIVDRYDDLPPAIIDELGSILWRY